MPVHILEDLMRKHTRRWLKAQQWWNYLNKMHVYLLSLSLTHGPAFLSNGAPGDLEWRSPGHFQDKGVSH